MKTFRFTTSWDDGSLLDLKMGDLLNRYGMKGTFYIPKAFNGSGGKFSAYNRRLSDSEIKDLSVRHEIGGHSLSHQSLTQIPIEQATYEIIGSREFIKDITGQLPRMFSFPRGDFNEAVVVSAKVAGFVGGRTTRKLSFSHPSGGFLMDVSMICQPFPFRKIDGSHYYWRRLLDPISVYRPAVWSLSWLSLAKRLFWKAYAEGDFFHLYGHSWEIEKYAMWSDLEKFLSFVKTHEGVTYLTNGEVIQKP